MICVFFFFKQKTAYEMRISDWSSDVCSSDLGRGGKGAQDKIDFTGQHFGRDAGFGAKRHAATVRDDEGCQGSAVDIGRQLSGSTRSPEPPRQFVLVDVDTLRETFADGFICG